jgi:ribonuclease R
LDATSGDTVRIKITKKRDGRDIEFGGRVEEVLERKTHRFVGTYIHEYEWGFVQVDGNQFVDPIVVGDSAAKNCNHGDKVVIEMVKFPSSHSEGEGVVVEVLGAHGQPGVDTKLVMSQYGLVAEFPEPVMECARQEADDFDERIENGRVDLTEEIIVTIDPKDARDFDDAISLKKVGDGHWLLGVHIADVSHFVQTNTALDDEAYKRGTSVYLPDRVVPMLPEIISNNLASLQPDRFRYAMSAFIEFTEDGARVKTEVKRTAIKSKRRFTYEEVDDFLDRPVAWRRKLDNETFALLERMHKLAMMLRGRRNRDGAIELHLPEVKVELDGAGKVSGAKVSKHTESHQIIEEFMLSANEAVATLFDDLEIPFLRRVHAKPNQQKLDDLTGFVKGLGIPCDSLVSRFEIQRLLDRVKGLPQQHAVNFGILKSMSKAKYSPEEDGHYALGSDAYCHFTSPIRRYPDLVIHRMVAAIAEGKKPGVDKKTLARIGDDCSAREENAERAERDLIKLKLLGYFADKIGMKMPAVITGVKRGGFFAQGTDLPVEGFVNARSLPNDRYHFDPRAMSLTGFRDENSFRLGDEVQVCVSKVDLDRRELDFELDSEKTAGRTPRRNRDQRETGEPNEFGRSRSRTKPNSRSRSGTKSESNPKSGSRAKSGSSSKSGTSGKRKPKSKISATQKGKPKKRKR